MIIELNIYDKLENMQKCEIFKDIYSGAHLIHQLHGLGKWKTYTDMKINKEIIVPYQNQQEQQQDRKKHIHKKLLYSSNYRFVK